MDDLDRELLNILQSEFPIATRPYRVLGERLGIGEDEALARTRSLVESGIVRRIGPSFDSRRLGHVSALVAANVPPERLDEVANIVSSFHQVTHNYGRESEYSLWFTLICRSDEELDRVLDRIMSRTGIADMHLLPAERMFKVRVNFEL